MKRKVVFICNRENLHKDLDFQLLLETFLLSQNVEIILEIANNKANTQIVPRNQFINKIIIFFRLRHLKEKLLSPFKTLQNLTSIQGRIVRIRETLSHLNLDEFDLYFIGRSAGAIVASKLTLEYSTKALIALGYPFFHPKSGKQRYRIKHLVRINCPMFVFQGIDDIYGKPHQIESIPLSPKIQIFPLVTDHDFDLSENDWVDFTQKLAAILY
jgi:hypothetical protein